MRTATNKMRLGTGIAVAVGLLTVGAVPAFSASANRPNGPCSKVGATATISGKAYVCANVLGKKLWQLPPAPTTTAAPAATAAPTTVASSSASNWDDVVAKAKQEGKVMFYSSQDPTLIAKVGEKFKAKYGITVEVYRDVDANLIPKVEAEKSTGKGIADVLAQSGAPWQVQRDTEGGWFVPVVGPDFNGPNFNKAANMSKTGSYFTSTAAVLTYAWNTQLYPKGLKDYPDFLDPALGNGKIGVIDPSGSSSITDFYYYLQERFGDSFVAKLASQRPRIYVSSLPMKAAVISGEIYAGVFIPPPIAEKAAGAPIDWGLSSTVWGARFLTSVLKTAPHPNAAQVWANYLISQEAQSILGGVSGSVYPGIGIMTTDKVRVQNTAKLGPTDVNAFVEKWRIMFT